MWTLVYKEFVQLKKYLLQMFGFLAVWILIFTKSAPETVSAFFISFAVVTAMTIPQLSFWNEERGNMFIFLRALPVNPSMIVAAKYVFSFSIILLFVVLFGIYGGLYVFSDDSRTLMTAVSAMLIVASTMAAISNFVHFLLGTKSAKSVLLVILVILGFPSLLVTTRNPEMMSALAANSVIINLLSLSGTPLGVFLALLIGMGIMLISFALASRVFCSRDISMLP